MITFSYRVECYGLGFVLLPSILQKTLHMLTINIKMALKGHSKKKKKGFERLK